MMSALSLIVLRCADLDASRTFYACLGINFEKEQHENGPVHYSSQWRGLVLELYPGKPGSAPEKTQAGSSMLGFLVESLDDVLASCQKLGVEIIRPPSDSPWGQRALVLDPDGRAVELMQR